VLKLFPVFGFASALRRPRRRELLLTGGALILFAVYAYGTRGDIRTIEHVVPQSRDYSYGLDISGRWLAARLPGSRHAWDALLALLVVAAAFTVGLLVRRGRPAATRDPTGYAYWVGAAIFIGTFLLAHNFDYRLAFLVLTLPQLLLWWNAGSTHAAVSLCALALTVWLVQGRALAIGAPAQLVLCALLGAGLVASLDWTVPVRLRAEARAA